MRYTSLFVILLLLGTSCAEGDTGEVVVDDDEATGAVEDDTTGTDEPAGDTEVGDDTTIDSG